jgi:hypothetical protein
MIKIIETKNRIWLLIVFLLIPFGAFMLGRVGGVSVLSDRNYSTEYTSPRVSVKEKEIVMVYVGASTCGFANDPDLPGIIEKTKLSLQERAGIQGIGFSAVGVSIDWDVKEGVQHLDKFGVFDEILTGRKWHGYGGRQFFWETLPSSLFATPQVLVIARTPDFPDSSLFGQEYPSLNETVLVRKIGVESITEWLEQGLSLPKAW